MICIQETQHMGKQTIYLSVALILMYIKQRWLEVWIATIKPLDTKYIGYSDIYACVHSGHGLCF